MKKRWIGLVIILMITFLLINPGSFSTKLLAKILGEYEEPEYISDESVLEYLAENDVHYNQVYRFKDMDHMEKFSQAGLLEIPLIYIYDSNKNLLAKAEAEKCAWAVSNFFINGESLVPTKDLTMLEMLREHAELISLPMDSTGFDFYIVTGWAMFVPKKSNQIFDRIREFSHTEKNICYINLNMDFRINDK